MLITLVSNAQCYILFQTKQIETASDSYSYNALVGRVVNGSNFGNFDQSCTAYIQFSLVERDSLIQIPGSTLDSIMIDSTHYTKYRISQIQGQGGAVNNEFPYQVMAGLYSQDAATFYATIYMVGQGNTRNGKPYPFLVLPLTEQPFIKKTFNLSDKEALDIWNQVKDSLK